MKKKQTREKTQRLVLASVFAALIAAMTFVPYTGYISIIPVTIEFTTLHIVTILAAVCLGWKYGTVIGGVWGMLCIFRALTNLSLWIDFLNPLISLFPRMAVGLVVGLAFAALQKTKLNKHVNVIIVTVLGTLTNTVLVLTAYNFFGGAITESLFVMFGNIYATIISINGLIELISAVILVPSLYAAVQKIMKQAN